VLHNVPAHLAVVASGFGKPIPLVGCDPDGRRTYWKSPRDPHRDQLDRHITKAFQIKRISYHPDMLRQTVSKIAPALENVEQEGDCRWSDYLADALELRDTEFMWTVACEPQLPGRAQEHLNPRISLILSRIFACPSEDIPLPRLWLPIESEYTTYPLHSSINSIKFAINLHASRHLSASNSAKPDTKERMERILRAFDNLGLAGVPLSVAQAC
jgi:hypothetical protein